MPRSIWKGPFIRPRLYSKVLASKQNPIKIWSRSSTIFPSFLGRSVLVHNGRTFIPVEISSNHIGHKFGEFAHTKLPAVFKRNKKKSKSK